MDHLSPFIALLISPAMIALLRLVDAAENPSVTVHPAEGRRGAPLPRVGCNGLLGLIVSVNNFGIDA